MDPPERAGVGTRLGYIWICESARGDLMRPKVETKGHPCGGGAEDFLFAAKRPEHQLVGSRVAQTFMATRSLALNEL